MWPISTQMNPRWRRYVGLRRFVRWLKHVAVSILSKLRGNRRDSRPIVHTLEAEKRRWRKEILEYSFQELQLFGYGWGDPTEAETREPNGKVLGNYLKIRNEYLIPEIGERAVMEIGSGGGKWTQYMLQAHQIICVDLIDEFFDYIRAHLPCANITFYRTSGNELAGVQDQSVDFIFSMDSLVRTPRHIIVDYFKEFARVLRPGGKMCLHLPCNDIPGSVERRFLDLSRDEIKTLCISNGLASFEIDDRTIAHGILLKVNYHHDQVKRV